jgi:hypothetical protein
VRFFSGRASTTGLARIPDGDDLLGINRRLSLGLGALGFGRSPRGCALPFLRSAVWAKLPAIEPQRMSSLYLYFDPGGGGVGWRRAITGFGSTYVTSGEYQCSRLIETRIGIKRGV